MHSDVFVQRGLHFRFGCRWRHRDQPTSGGLMDCGRGNEEQAIFLHSI